MALFNGWPWAQFQEQNLDWFIKKLKEFEGRVDEMEEWIRSLQETVHADVAEILDTWLADGTIDQIVANAVKYKAWMFDSINSIPADVTLEVGDTVTTGSAVYMVANSGIPAGNYYLYPVSYTRAQDLGLAADGVTNDRSQFIILLNVLPVIDLHGATVLLNGSTLTMQSNRKIMNGCIKWGSSSGTLFTADGVSNVVFDTVEFDCSASAVLGKKISLVNTEKLTFRNCYIHDWFGTFARLNGASNLRIVDCFAENSTGDTGDVGACFYINGGSDLVFDRLRSYHMTDALIYLDGTGVIRRVEISNITSKNHNGDQLPHAISLYGDCQLVNITNVSISDSDQGIRIQNRNSVTPSYININNVTIDNVYGGIDITGLGTGTFVSHILINNANIKTQTQDGITVTSIKFVTISNCTISAGRAGVKLISSGRCYIDNTIAFLEVPGASVGFTLDADSNNNILQLCKVINLIADTLTGFQDMRTETTSRNKFLFCTAAAEVQNSAFVLAGFDVRESQLIFPQGTNNVNTRSMYFTTLQTANGRPNKTAGDIAFNQSGTNNGWRYTGSEWTEM